MNKYILRLNKIYNYLFKEKLYKKIRINWGDYPNRTELIQKIIDLKEFKSYLEIGCDDDVNFDKIKINLKIGVDPISGGNIRKTSDQFFRTNKEYFDCVFIDGLHEYSQVRKDIKNSLDFLNNGGIIFLHDCLPRSYFEQAIPRSQHLWTGDVWKAIVEFRTKEEVDICVGLLDMGLGIIVKRKNSNKLNMHIKNFKKLKYEDYYYNQKNFMNIVEYEKIIQFIDQ